MTEASWLLAALLSGMSTIEWIAALLLLINVVLVARRSMLNYPFGISAVILYGVMAVDARLYAIAALQIIFLALNIYGWMGWRRAQAETARGEVPVGWLSWQGRGLSAAATLIGWIALGWALTRWTDAVAPLADGAVVAVSLAGQALQAQRRADCWWFWIAANAISVPLFASQNMVVTAGVYAVLLGVAVAGLIAWQRAARGATPPKGVAA
jgi:nicotinamide mononucleotide transporter